MTKQYRVTYEFKYSGGTWAKRSSEPCSKRAARAFADAMADERNHRNITIESREVSDWVKEAE